MKGELLMMEKTKAEDFSVRIVKKEKSDLCGCLILDFCDHPIVDGIPVWECGPEAFGCYEDPCGCYKDPRGCGC